MGADAEGPQPGPTQSAGHLAPGRTRLAIRAVKKPTSAHLLRRLNASSTESKKRQSKEPQK